MFSKIIFFITAAFGFLSVANLFVKNKHQEHSLINKYLFIIIAVNAARFFFHGILEAYPETNITKFVNLLDASTIMLMPCLYLYFDNIINEKKFQSKNLLHFVVPLIIGIGFAINSFDNSTNSDLFKKIFFVISISFYLTYALFGFVMLYKNAWNRKSEIKAIQKQNNLIKKWTVFLYVCFVLMLVTRVTTSIISKKPGSFNNDYLWIPSLVWMVVFVFLILTPDVLYGYNFLNKTIDAAAEKLVLKSVWVTEITVITMLSERDKKIDEKMKPLLMEYLHRIEELSFHTHAFRNPDLSLDNIAEALNIPISHINFIFKYHCNESFTDYKKIVRIHDATKLLEGGYLNEHKVETLSAKVGFSSYNTFIVAFKNITGVTTQEYGKRF
jgi:AraC-like DNA-binding protein